MVEKKYLRHYPFKHARRPAVRHPARDLPGRDRGPRPYRGVEPGHADRQGRDRGELRPLPARHRRLHARDRELVRQPRRHESGRPGRTRSRARQLRLTLDLGPPARRPGGGGAGARGRAHATATRPRRARSWRWIRATARSGARLLPELRREPVREAARPGAHTTQLNSRGDRRAAVQPRDPRRRSDRLDLQADDRLRVAGHRGSSPRPRPSSTPACSSSATASSRTRATRCSARWPSRARSRSPPTSSSTAWRRAPTARADSRGLGAPARVRPAGRASTSRRVRRPGAGPPLARQRATTGTAAAPEKATVPAGHEEALYDCGGIERFWSAATTSTSPSARATCRPPRCSSPRLRGDRQRRPRRHAAPRPAASRTAGAAWSRRSASPPRGASSSSGDDQPRSSRAARRRAREGGTSADVFAGFP